ncbi:probable basic-leucine zipper transcription factor N [Cydia splendana]|uniref:probable basic-leucine zipper transcription factor N n=1 Tax=Cydia splendana TaxID=1100963 RepID=UPI00300D4FC5
MGLQVPRANVAIGVPGGCGGAGGAVPARRRRRLFAGNGARTQRGAHAPTARARTALNRIILESDDVDIFADSAGIMALAASTTGNPVPPSNPTASSPKYVPVFISADALNRIDEKDGQASQPVESGQEKLNDINKESQNILYGPPAPVYEHQPEQREPSYTPPMPQSYQTNQQLQQQQYPNMQTPIQQAYPNQQSIQQPYPVNQQTFQTQQPNQIQQYQISQPQSQTFYPMNQQPAQQNQPILVTQQTGSQPLYGNQQQILPLNQQPLLNQQQLVSQPIQTYQQPNQLLISQPGNQQTLLTQSQPILLNQQTPMPNQQILLQPNQNGLIQQIPNQQGQQAIILQPNQNGQMIASNISPINPLANQVNPGYIQNQNQNVYAVVPLNGQNLGSNQNVGSNTYLVPVQQVPNQVFAVNSG